MTDQQQKAVSEAPVSSVAPMDAGAHHGSSAAGDTQATQSGGLQIQGLVKQYANSDHPVLNGISLEVPAGKVMVILGPSGSGKSTLLRTVAGLESMQGGQILMDGKPLDRHDVGMVFQSYDLFPNKTVLGNIIMAPMLVHKRSKEDATAEAMRLLERVGLADRKDAWPHELSGGQRQRVAICRALIMHPRIMLFDEVTAALDPEMVREVLDVIVELADQGLTMMIVTHEMAFARAVADRIVLLDGGKLVEQSDDAEAFFTHPQTERAQQFLQTFAFERGHHTQNLDDQA